MLEVTIPYSSCVAAEEVGDDDHTIPIHHGGETKEVEDGMASSEERPLDHVMGIAEQSMFMYTRDECDMSYSNSINI